ncbi:MAG: hypothetical protein E2577_13660 [Starkeya sp.]|nr:hypothetical protein [Starkeya sp.]
MNRSAVYLSDIAKRKAQIADITDRRDDLGGEMMLEHIDNRFGGYCFVSREKAIDALDAKRPAFATVATYHQGAWGAFAIYANESGLDAALAWSLSPTHPAMSRDVLLGTLIPLNTAADEALAAHDHWAAAAPSLIAAE